MNPMTCCSPFKDTISASKSLSLATYLLCFPHAESFLRTPQAQVVLSPLDFRPFFLLAFITYIVHVVSDSLILTGSLHVRQSPRLSSLEIVICPFVEIGEKSSRIAPFRSLILILRASSKLCYGKVPGSSI